MEKLKELWYSLSLKTRDKLARAAKTAGQVFITSFPLASLATHDVNVIWPAVLAAGSAAVSAAWNTIFPPSSGEAVLVPYPVAAGDLLPPKED